MAGKRQRRKVREQKARVSTTKHLQDTAKRRRDMRGLMARISNEEVQREDEATKLREQQAMVDQLEEAERRLGATQDAGSH